MVKRKISEILVGVALGIIMSILGVSVLTYGFLYNNHFCIFFGAAMLPIIIAYWCNLVIIIKEG